MFDCSCWKMSKTNYQYFFLKFVGNYLSMKGKGALEGIAYYWEKQAIDLQHFIAPLFVSTQVNLPHLLSTSLKFNDVISSYWVSFFKMHIWLTLSCFVSCVSCLCFWIFPSLPKIKFLLFYHQRRPAVESFTHQSANMSETRVSEGCLCCVFLILHERLSLSETILWE